MKKTKNCKHCYQLFEARRSNHVYCTTSCKTKASYKRNDYQYVSGHYKKVKELSEMTGINSENLISQQITKLEDKIDLLEKNKNLSGLNTSGIKNSAAGTLIADASIYGLKKVLAPNTLPATKGDIESLKKDILSLKTLLTIKK
ncbi:hypothetical protein [Psychroserpens sp. Hel_I_66]|uniref:hypothetical protein n=1 Tax=Psychroserpens sp. Hel_I_66 TaxID=1250004 RepID=UPI0006467AB9|nr:hypothetical protein [Psychroserpens sp. Hel_I_66]